MARQENAILIAGAVFALAIAVFALSVAVPMPGQTKSISGSGHDLSLNGQGPAKATTQNDVCIFCHAPHNALPGAPLWNHKLSVAEYNLYTSSTYVQINGQSVAPRSKLCLSCHDGTVALGQTVANGLIPMTGSLAAPDILGTNLSADHPFSFQMPAIDDGEIKLSLTASPPTTSDPAVKLYNNAIECVTCHEPHDPSRDTAMPFMVRSNTNSALCVACHDTSRGMLAGWNSGAHATGINTVAPGSGLPYTNPSAVSTNACANCHTGHNAAGTGARLLRGVEQSTCATCHGNVANLTPVLLDIISELNKFYTHPVLTSPTPAHDPSEAIPVTASRHSACPDCHNPHASQAAIGTPIPPTSQVSLSGTSGVSAFDGITVLKPAVNQYEICFKCHANNTNKPQNANYSVYGRTVYRVTYALAPDPYNVRLNLQSTVARHNVTQSSRGNVAPSLRPTMLDLSGNTTGRSLLGAGLYLYCTDCHNNNAARVSGGAGPNGPHGSTYYHLMERRYEYDAVPATPGGNTIGPAYSSGVLGPYAICDKCHDLDNALVSQSSTADTVFHKHWRHVVSVGSSCSTCHASHGIRGGGTTINNTHLVDFDTKVVGPDNQGRLYFDSTARTCYLTCHGVLHNPMTY